MSRVEISFEVFPPKSIDASFHLWEAVQVLDGFDPRFFSVTYGAGGSSQDLTHEAAKAMHEVMELPVAAHLTCAGASKNDVLQTAQRFADAGIKNIVALRGDPQKGQKTFVPHPDGFLDSCELIRALHDRHDFNIRVGAYPESHCDAQSEQQNIDWLKAKIDAGACEAITQFFYEADTFLRFRDRCVGSGITVPITPGILPVSNWDSAQRFSQKCGASIPVELAKGFDNAQRDGCSRLFAVAQCSELCDDLMQEGVERLHFYTLNRADLTRDVLHALGVSVTQNIRHVA